MTRKLLVGAIAAGALIVTAGTAFALSSDDRSPTPSAQVTTSTFSSDVTPTSEPTSSDTPTPSDAQPGSLTAADASRIATDRFGGTVREVELEFEHGRVVWEVEITAADGVTYDVDVDSSTGEITRVRQDDRRGGDDGRDDDRGFDDHGGDHHGDDDRGGDDHGGHDRGGDDHGGGRHGGDDD